MDEGLGTLLGALVGGGAAIGGAILVETWKERCRARQSAIASAAELEAAVDITRVRMYREGMAAFLAAARAGTVGAFSVHLPPEVIPVTRSAVKNPGPMPPKLVKALARIVVLTDALESDMRRITAEGVGESESDGAFLSKDDPEFAVGFYVEILRIFDAWTKEIDQYVTAVAAKYPG